jgi:hypothetical protein
MNILDMKRKLLPMIGYMGSSDNGGGGYSDGGRLLRGSGNVVSDSIPA